MFKASNISFNAFQPGIYLNYIFFSEQPPANTDVYHREETSICGTARRGYCHHSSQHVEIRYFNAFLTIFFGNHAIHYQLFCTNKCPNGVIFLHVPAVVTEARSLYSPRKRLKISVLHQFL